MSNTILTDLFVDEFIGKAIDTYSSAKQGEYVFNEKEGVISIPNSADILSNFREEIDTQIELLKNISNLITKGSVIDSFSHTSLESLYGKFWGKLSIKDNGENTSEVQDEASNLAREEYDELLDSFKEEVIKLYELIRELR